MKDIKKDHRSLAKSTDSQKCKPRNLHLYYNLLLVKNQAFYS